MKFSILTYKYRQSGNLGWIYNPFFNLRVDNKLTKFITKELKFDYRYPVDLLPLPSYDGSVNLIINDGISPPKLINSRFSTTGKDTYQIVDRKGNSDTNIYDSGDLFEIDSSLYKITTKIPKISYLGTQHGGNLKVGNYFFYFKLADSDGNETDFIGLSLLVSVFLGEGSFNSVTTGVKNLNSYKLVRFKFENIDTAYSFIRVYYSRSTAEDGEKQVTEYKKILENYTISNSYNCTLNITGFENAIDVTEQEINNRFNVVASAKTQTQVGGRLILGNVKKYNIDYNALVKYSLNIVPEIKSESYFTETELVPYENLVNTFIDSKYIYDNLGYAPNEFYRLGIVYILPFGELTPVFNIRGGEVIAGNHWEELKEITYNDSDYMLTGLSNRLNAKGVVIFKDFNEFENHKIVFKNLNSQHESVSLFKGFFFVRLKRIPLCLAQGLTLGVDNTSHTPTIPISDVDVFVNNTSNTHLVYDKSKSPLYITEGFLSRYNYRFSPKKATFASTVLKAGIAVVGVAACVVATVYGGPAGLALSAKLLGTAAATTAIGSGVAVGAGIAAAAATATVATAYAALESYNAINNALADTNTNGVVDGRKIACPTGTYKKEEDLSRQLTHDYDSHIIIKDNSHNKVLAIICPESIVNPYKFNQIFNGSTHYIEEIKNNNVAGNTLTMAGRHFYPGSYKDLDSPNYGNYKVIPIDDGLQIAGVDDYLFRGRAGNAEEAYTYECIGEDYKTEASVAIGSEDEETLSNKKINSDIVRGNFGAYLGFTNSNNKIQAAKLVKIYIPNYSKANYDTYFQIRITDSSPFYAISDRLQISDFINNSITVAGGDSYLCEFTHRIIRNFNDPSAPYNDEIVDENCWKENYEPGDEEKLGNINLGDVNAVKLGMWVSFRCRSNYNLNVRTLDGSYADEANMVGHPRTYYPRDPMSVEGAYKTLESRIYNQGFAENTSSQIHIELPNVPALKNWYGTRVMYSEQHVTDAFRNGYRVFLGTTYRDYGNLYGEITKLVALKGAILIVFEHGIGLAQLLVSLHPVALLTPTNLLPELLTMISDTYGSLWQDSIIKTDQFVYGIDTCAKKIWRTDGQSLQGLSDNTVQEFLNNNINLTEADKKPIIGIKNVASYYNADKKDVMFTFKNNIYANLDVSWNLCFNELLNKFITFYSWIPSMMENIDNIPFSFDSNVTKLYASIGNTYGEVLDGILLSLINKAPETTFEDAPSEKTPLSPGDMVFNEPDEVANNETTALLKDSAEKQELSKDGLVATYTLKYFLDSEDITDDIKFTIVKGDDCLLEGTRLFIDPKIYKDFQTNYDLRGRRIINEDASTNDYNATIKYIWVNVYKSKKIDDNEVVEINKTFIVPIKPKKLPESDFWKHGHAGIIDVKDDIKPAAWYGQQHPFEFEFVVVDHPGVHKIFTNLEIVANKAKPESFHYEIVGECYDFAKDKPNMYFRQEATKAMWLYNGVDITYDHNIINMLPLHLNPRSAELLKTYYERLDHLNTIEDYYVHQGMQNKSDYRHLSGAEIVRYKKRDEYRIWNHTLAVSMDELRQDDARSLIAANCNYLEDRWRVVINPILVCYKNEYYNNKSTWFNFMYLKNGKVVDPFDIPQNAVYSPNRDIYTSGLDTYKIIRLPKLTIFNSSIPDTVLKKNSINLPSNELDSNDIFKTAYTDTSKLDASNWADDSSIYKTQFGLAQNRKEIDLKDKFIKVRIRYKGDELAIIDYINTIYQESYS